MAVGDERLVHVVVYVVAVQEDGELHRRAAARGIPRPQTSRSHVFISSQHGVAKQTPGFLAVTVASSAELQATAEYHYRSMIAERSARALASNVF